MFETDPELAELQTLLDSSFARASTHLRSIMTEPCRLSAARLVHELPAPAVLNVATVTAAGEPRLSAVDGHFLHGQWYFTTDGASPKARQLRARPSISASFTPRDGFGVFCHGTAAEPSPSQRELLRQRFVEVYGVVPEELAATIAYVRVDANWLVAFAMTEEEEAAIEAERAGDAG